MGDKISPLALGTIICKHCANIIDTIDTERVITYYSQCDESLCIEQRPEREKQTYGTYAAN